MGKMMWFIVPRSVSWWRSLLVSSLKNRCKLFRKWMNTHSVLYLLYGQRLCFVDMENGVLLEISENYFQMLQYVEPGKLQKHLLSFFRPADDHQQFLPTGSLRKKKLAKRPGYMRPEAQRQIEFQPLGACTGLSPAELQHGQQHCGGSESCALHRQRPNDSEFLHCSAAVPANGVTTLATTGNTPGCRENVLCCNSPRSDSTGIGVCPAATTDKGGASALCCTWQKSHSTKVSEPPNMYALDQTEVNNNCEYQNRDGISHSAGASDSFSSSFSFIQLSLNSASGVNEVEGKSNEEAEIGLHPKTTGNLQKPEEMAQTREHLGDLCCFSRSGEDLRHEHESPVNDKLQDCETVSLSDTDATFSYSTDSSDAASAGSSVTSGYESSFTVSDHNWDTLMKKYEPVLQDCLLGNRSTIKVSNLTLFLMPLPQNIFIYSATIKVYVGV